MFDSRTKVQLLLKLNDIYFWNKIEGAGKWMYIFVIQYVQQKGLETREWAGKMKRNELESWNDTSKILKRVLVYLIK